MAKAFTYTLSILLSLVLGLGGLITGMMIESVATGGFVVAIFGFALFGACLAAAAREPSPLYATQRTVSQR